MTRFNTSVRMHIKTVFKKKNNRKADITPCRSLQPREHETTPAAPHASVDRWCEHRLTEHGGRQASTPTRVYVCMFLLKTSL